VEARVLSETLIYIRGVGKDPVQWSPARAVPISGGLYRITDVPAGEALEFGVGDVVKGQMSMFPDGSEALLAVARA
jgi:hypothetical protein